MAPKNEQMISAVFRDRMDWQNVYEWLRDRGYSPQEINVLMSESTRNTYLSSADEEPVHVQTRAAEGIAAGGVAGTAIGATLAAILALGTTVLIPPLGIWIAGPLAAAFAGAGAGAVTGGVLGGLLGLGISEPTAKVYQEALREGGVVVGVVPHSKEDRDAIENVFKTHHGENVCSC
jgi:hypothetical protein